MDPGIKHAKMIPTSYPLRTSQQYGQRCRSWTKPTTPGSRQCQLLSKEAQAAPPAPRTTSYETPTSIGDGGNYEEEGRRPLERQRAGAVSLMLRQIVKSWYSMLGSADGILPSLRQNMGFKTPSVDLRSWHAITSRFGSPRRLLLAVAVMVVFTFALGAWQVHDAEWLRGRGTQLSSKPEETTIPRYWSATTGPDNLRGVMDFQPPANLSIVALVFYGRPAYVSVLDCYLKRNLKQNGGLLDEVIWIARTKSSDDIAWLDALVETSPFYRKHDVSSFEKGDYRTAWTVVKNGTMYIKIDDDIVFFEDTAIPSLVEKRLTHPEYFMVSANVINQPSLSWIHYSLGAVLPFLPELEPPADFVYRDFKTNAIMTFDEFGNSTDLTDYESYTPIPTDSWRPSELPTWSGPADYKYDIDNFIAPFNGHRWLPVDTSSNTTDLTLDNTPIFHSNFDAFGPSLYHWEIGAQQHSSFFTHLEANTLWRYKFDTWDYRYTRMGIQFMAIMGDDVWASMPLDRDDEMWFSEDMPRKFGRHAVIDGRAVASHFSFGPQRPGMEWTDLLGRYRAFATENICVS